MTTSSVHRPVPAPFRPAPFRLLVGLLAAMVATLAVLAGGAAPAGAGGWAVGSLDPMPAATAGETTQVGFTVLQHGVTPADLQEDVGIVIRLADGSEEFFPAVSDGTPGHYVAPVTFPEASGSYSWSIRMGWFPPQELGTLAVGDADSGGSLWPTARWVVLAATLVLAAVAVVDLAAGRRRRQVALG